MSTLLEKFKKAADEAALRSDHTKTAALGEYTPPAAGKTVARLVEYVEIGLQPGGVYLGKAKKPSAKVMLVFELLGKNRIKTVERDGKKVEVADRISTGTISLSLNGKAAFKKLFDKMRYGRQEITHMSQMLDDVFRVEVHHSTNKDGKVFASLRTEDGWSIGAPFVEEIDEDGNVTGKRRIACPPALSEHRLFLWDQPTKDMWDSLYIDGTYEDAEGKEISRNRLQAKIISALNYEGSPVEALLAGLDVDDLRASTETVVAGDEDYADFGDPVVEDGEEVEEAPKPEKAKPAAKARAKVSPSNDDTLAALGL